MNELLKDYHVTIDIPIAWGEMDAFQHVNNVVYFRYFETGRVAYMHAMKLPNLIGDNGIGPILAAVDCRFRLPLTHPDTITVGVKTTTFKEDRFIVNHVVISHRYQKVAAHGEGMIVSYDYNVNKKVALPETWKKIIANIERW
ncbi:thioesterase family protein [Anaerolineales bacterium HSG6]|nr:thioesterase family protein [Anaerolineales bacterium HSG6]